MAKSYFDQMQEQVTDSIIRLKAQVDEVYPVRSVLQIELIKSYQQMTPEQQAQIVEQLGPDWYVNLAAKLEKQIRALTTD